MNKIKNGLVARDEKQNEWVWIEVPKTIYTDSAYLIDGAVTPTSDEDYENIDSEKEYANILTSGEYDLHFVVGKTYENAEKIELLDGHKYSLNHYSDDIYEDDYAIRDIGDMSLNMDNLMGLLFEYEEDTDEIAVHPADFEHGGEISQPRIRKCDDSGDLEEILKNMLERFIIQ